MFFTCSILFRTINFCHIPVNYVNTEVLLCKDVSWRFRESRATGNINSTQLGVQVYLCKVRAHTHVPTYCTSTYTCTQVRKLQSESKKASLSAHCCLLFSGPGPASVCFVLLVPIIVCLCVCVDVGGCSGSAVCPTSFAMDNSDNSSDWGREIIAVQTCDDEL